MQYIKIVTHSKKMSQAQLTNQITGNEHDVL